MTLQSVLALFDKIFQWYQADLRAFINSLTKKLCKKFQRKWVQRLTHTFHKNCIVHVSYLHSSIERNVTIMMTFQRRLMSLVNVRSETLCRERLVLIVMSVTHSHHDNTVQSSAMSCFMIDLYSRAKDDESENTKCSIKSFKNDRRKSSLVISIYCRIRLSYFTYLRIVILSDFVDFSFLRNQNDDADETCWQLYKTCSDRAWLSHRLNDQNFFSFRSSQIVKQNNDEDVIHKKVRRCVQCKSIYDIVDVNTCVDVYRRAAWLRWESLARFLWHYCTIFEHFTKLWETCDIAIFWYRNIAQKSLLNFELFNLIVKKSLFETLERSRNRSRKSLRYFEMFVQSPRWIFCICIAIAAARHETLTFFFVFLIQQRRDYSFRKNLSLRISSFVFRFHDQ